MTRRFMTLCIVAAWVDMHSYYLFWLVHNIWQQQPTLHQDQDVERDCVGWASYNKNFSFVREALEVMCSPEFNVTGVLVANKNKANTKACTIPSSCHGKIVQTTFLDQGRFFGYLSKVSETWLLFVKNVCSYPSFSPSPLRRRDGHFCHKYVMPVHAWVLRPCQWISHYWWIET
mgnify:CR=1 FL=1